MGAAALFAAVLGRLLVACIATAAVLVALVMAGVSTLRDLDDDPVPWDAYGTDPDGGWRAP